MFVVVPCLRDTVAQSFAGPRHRWPGSSFDLFRKLFVGTNGTSPKMRPALAVRRYAEVGEGFCRENAEHPHKNPTLASIYLRGYHATDSTHDVELIMIKAPACNSPITCITTLWQLLMGAVGRILDNGDAEVRTSWATFYADRKAASASKIMGMCNACPWNTGELKHYF